MMMDAPRDLPRDDLTELPLFPLNLVLFPGMQLPLHIFEERYKAMIGDCIARDAPFGVALIKEGPEVGGPAEPNSIGATARILQVQRLPEGRLNLLTQGERRFQLVAVIQEIPHLVGLVRFIEEETGEVAPDTLADVREEYADFLRQLSNLAGSWNAPVSAPENPPTLSFAAAATLATSIELPTGLRQELLAAATAGERLTQLLPLLRRSNELVREQAAKNNPYQGPRLN